MKTLKDFLDRINEISNIVSFIGTSGTNGINTLSNRVELLKNNIANNDFTYTNFHPIFDEFNQDYKEEEIKELNTKFQIFLKDLSSINDKLNINLIETFKVIFEKDDFIDNWNSLTNEEKENILFLDKEIYKIIREKIDVKEFNFLFKTNNIFDGNYPQEIFEWINTPANSKISFYKLRKNSQNTTNEDFFNLLEVKNAESEDISTREKIAINYLINKKKFDSSEVCWYERLDMLINYDVSFHYTYHFFQELEDEFNGYNHIKDNIKLPDILKKWSGQMIDVELYEKEMLMFNQEIQGKSKKELDEIYRTYHNKYPSLKKAEDLQRKLTKNEFILLKEESKNTEFEDFFNNPITEKMHCYMPYKRKDYMFIYFREKFTNNVKITHKPK